MHRKTAQNFLCIFRYFILFLACCRLATGFLTNKYSKPLLIKIK